MKRGVVFAFTRNPENTLFGADCSARYLWSKDMAA